jgi:hypothetical protein
MQSNFRHQQFNTMPKQAGVTASNWLSIDSPRTLGLKPWGFSFSVNGKRGPVLHYKQAQTGGL